jgi:glycine hydroxymethyltransferase
VTTQGMREGEMRQIAGMIAAAVRADPNTAAGASTLRETAGEASDLVGRFPAYAQNAVPA